MPFLIETFDKPDSLALRQQHRPAHLDFLRENAAALLACGAKLSDDGETASGSIYIVDVETRAEAEAFLALDPFSQVELPGEVRITRWRKVVLDGKAFI
ncbi:MAG: YciI family protein [Pseudomonas oryzihabitans]